MLAFDRACRGNLLLQGLPDGELARLEARLQPVSLNPAARLVAQGDRFEHVYFIESGIASFVGNTPERRGVSINLVGREGLIGAELALGVDRAAHDCIVRLPGTASRIHAAELQAFLQDHTVLRARILSFVHALMVQGADTAVSNGMLTIEPRLARCLLMCHDRIDGDELPITHGTLAAMLGVRRASVTVGLHILEGERMIRSLRGRIIVFDRARLEHAARGCYGAAEAEYRRVLERRSPLPPAPPADPSRLKVA
jgi:CRP-like cAMP-binding protein